MPHSPPFAASIRSSAVGTHLDDLVYRQVELQGEVLRHEGHLAGDLAAPVLARRPTPDEHRTRDRREHAIDQVEQRALATAVRSDNADEIAGCDLERQAPEHRVVDVVGERHLAHLDKRGRVVPAGHARLPRRNR